MLLLSHRKSSALNDKRQTIIQKKCSYTLIFTHPRFIFNIDKYGFWGIDYINTVNLHVSAESTTAKDTCRMEEMTEHSAEQVRCLYHCFESKDERR